MIAYSVPTLYSLDKDWSIARIPIMAENGHGLDAAADLVVGFIIPDVVV